MKKKVNGEQLYCFLLIGAVGHFCLTLISLAVGNEFWTAIHAFLILPYAVCVFLFVSVWEDRVYFRDRKQRTLN